MQNREVPLGSLPIFFSSLRLAEAGRTCPEVRGGRQGAEHGQPSAGRRRRSHGHGRGVRGAGDGGTGAGCGAAGAGCGARVRNTEDAGVGRRTQNAEHVDADAGTGNGGTGCRTQNAERRTQNTGYWPRAAEHGKRGHEVQKTEDAGTGCRTQNTGYWPRAAEHGKRGHGARETGDGAQETGHKPPRMERNATAYAPPGPATTGLDRSQPGAIRRRDQSAGTFHGWTPAAGTRNNPPGHSQPGAIRHRDLQQPAGAVHSRAPSAAGRRYLSRVRIRITPLPPRTPYMLLPRCTSTDLTS